MYTRGGGGREVLSVAREEDEMTYRVESMLSSRGCLLLCRHCDPRELQSFTSSFSSLFNLECELLQTTKKPFHPVPASRPHPHGHATLLKGVYMY
jgi:hypothetical protein